MTLEHYQLYHRFEAVIEPLEGGLPALEALALLPYDGFACCSPCDAHSETPQVPAFLPRHLPVGNYRFGVYHDAAHLYVALDTEEGPPVEGLSGQDEALETLILFHPDGDWYYTLTLHKEPVSGGHLGYHGPHDLQKPSPIADWEGRRITRGASTVGPRWRALWRVALFEIKPLLRTGRLRASLSRTTFRTMEGVAWGAYGIWGPRFDECGSFLFPEANRAPRAPLLDDLRLEYCPENATARLQCRWSGAYPEGTRVSNPPTEKLRCDMWDYFTLRVNGHLQKQRFNDPLPSAPFFLINGFNEIHVTTRGSNGVRLFLEIASPNTIVLGAEREAALALPAHGGCTPAPAAVREWACAGIEAMMTQWNGPWERYERWMGPFGSAVARWASEGAAPGRHWSEWVSELASSTLRFQREDGTFSGHHLSASGTSDFRWRSGAYDSGQIGELWVNAYIATGEARFLEASTKLMNAYSGYRIEFNHNFAAFGIYHLAAHYRLTQAPLALAHMEYYLEHCIARHILPLGFHGGHNYYSIYASIILRSIALGSLALPEGHRLQPVLHDRMRRMANQVLFRLQKEGPIDARDRHFAGELQWDDSLFAAACALKGEDRHRIERVIAHLLEQAMAASPNITSDVDYSKNRSLRIAISPSLAMYLYQKNPQ